MHQVVVSNRNETWGTTGDLFRALQEEKPFGNYRVTWLPAGRIKEGDRSRGGYVERETSYADHLAGRPLVEPMAAVLAWLTVRVKALDVVIDEGDRRPEPEHNLPPGWQPVR